MERKGLLQIAGQDVTIIGADIHIGQTAPDFTVQDMNWATVNGLELTHGKVRIIGSLPSLNTSVCDRETRRFNLEAAALGSDIAILMVSTDLPYAIKNWCAAAGVDQVITLSDHMTAEFGEKYGVLVKERRTLRRAIFVVDRKGTVVYVAYMPVSSEEPKYDEVLAAARAAL
jgi:thioredoxin-dependent peroxiredoxin